MGNKKDISKKDRLKDLSETTNKVKLPRGEQFIGIVEKRLGGSRMKIRKLDGSECMAIVPGRMKKFLWIRENDIVLLEPWKIEKEKSDLIYKYSQSEIRKLQKKGIVDEIEQVEEF